ncbi:MAG TPA: serine dehydratase [Acholeplasmataceae bacterium]|nr:serine dehydratase [Acholeplasmataceae bacterium]
METLKELFKIGRGPSSSHTMGPAKAAEMFLDRNKKASKFKVELYGSLAFTGKGHLTDVALKAVLGENTVVEFHSEIIYTYHANGMKFFAYLNDEIINEWLVFSVGGGALKELDEKRNFTLLNIYQETSMDEILNYCKINKISLLEYAIKNEEIGFREYMNNIVTQMFATVEEGLIKTEVLPGKLQVRRKAKKYYENYLKNNLFSSLVFANALAVSEENASGGNIVIAPTCGSSGVMPGVLKSFYDEKKYTFEQIVDATIVGGLIGNLVKTNASISGAEVGCQGEVGTACAMAAAALAHLKGGTNNQIEYAAEIALEHHLGMTCDPILGYVQIPCIERNAISAMRAIDSANYALVGAGEHLVTLDMVIESLKETGADMHVNYRETSLGGLAKHLK